MKKQHDGQVVKAAMKAGNTSIEQVAEALGISVSHAYRRLKDENWTTAELIQMGDLMGDNLFLDYVTEEISLGRTKLLVLSPKLIAKANILLVFNERM